MKASDPVSNGDVVELEVFVSCCHSFTRYRYGDQREGSEEDEEN
jgi:hypothetical protein